MPYRTLNPYQQIEAMVLELRLHRTLLLLIGELVVIGLSLKLMRAIFSYWWRLVSQQVMR